MRSGRSLSDQILIVRVHRDTSGIGSVSLLSCLMLRGGFGTSNEIFEAKFVDRLIVPTWNDWPMPTPPKALLALLYRLQQRVKTHKMNYSYQYCCELIAMHVESGKVWH